MKKNIFIIILAFLVVGLGGFITYDNFFKPSTKCDTSNSKTSTITKDSKKADSKTVESADERYKAYLSNLSKSIQKTYGEKNGAGMRPDELIYNNEQEYEIILDKNQNLLFTSFNNLEKYNNYVLASDVVAFYRIPYGNGGFYSIYYITSKGEVHSAFVEQLQDDGSIKDTKVDVKNIIDIQTVNKTDADGLGGSHTIFIDIDGNIIEK